MKRPSALLPMTLAALAACGDAPTGVAGDADAAVVADEIVITDGVAPPRRFHAPDPLFGDGASRATAAGVARLVGAVASPVTARPASCGGAAAGVVLTYTVTGARDGAASFRVPTAWTYDGTTWTGASPIVVTLPARAAYDAPTIRKVPITVSVAGAGEGATRFTFAPSDWVAPGGDPLPAGDGEATVHVDVVGCPSGDAPPSIVVPSDLTIEATSTAGATVAYAVTASDAEDGILTGEVMCSVPSGATLPVGETTVRCLVTDEGGRSASGSFRVRVVDTSAPFFTSLPSDTVRLVAASADGAVLDPSAIGIAVADERSVSPATIACDEADGTRLPIGSTLTVTCRARDARGNASATATVDVVVGLDAAGAGFLAPLRMEAPYAVHRRGATIRHRFRAPTYADGTPATDLASGLRFVVQRVAGPAAAGARERPAAAPWRYDAASGEYVFDLATPAAWAPGTWTTTVSYAGVPIARTRFELR